MDEIIGFVLPWAGLNIPDGFLPCDGRSLPFIDNKQDTDYTPLYSVIGSAYGGDGISNFNLPDFRYRVPVGAGNAGPFPVNSGNTGGTLNLNIAKKNLPPHTHAAKVSIGNSNIQVSANGATDSTPTGSLILAAPQYMSGGNPVSTDGYNTDKPNTALNSASFAITTQMAVHNEYTGNGNDIAVTPPFFGINYIICYIGTYPTPQ